MHYSDELITSCLQQGAPLLSDNSVSSLLLRASAHLCVYFLSVSLFFHEHLNGTIYWWNGFEKKNVFTVLDTVIFLYL